MSDHDKMMAFGHWLAERRVVVQAELCAIAVDRTKPIDAIRIKAGHVEAYGFVFEVFRELYNGDLNKFKVERLGHQPEPEEESHGDSTSPA